LIEKNKATTCCSAPAYKTDFIEYLKKLFGCNANALISLQQFFKNTYQERQRVMAR